MLQFHGVLGFFSDHYKRQRSFGANKRVTKILKEMSIGVLAKLQLIPGNPGGAGFWGASDVCAHWYFGLVPPPAPSLGSVRQEESPPPCHSLRSLAILPSPHCSVVLGLFYTQHPGCRAHWLEKGKSHLLHFPESRSSRVFSCLPLPRYLFAGWDYLPSLYFMNDFFHFYLGTIPASRELPSKELESVSESLATPMRTAGGRHRGLVSP